MDSRRISKRELVSLFQNEFQNMLHTYSVEGNVDETISKCYDDYMAGNIDIYTFQKQIQEVTQKRSAKGNIYSAIVNCLDNYSNSDLAEFMSNIIDTLGRVVYNNLKEATDTESIIVPLFEGMNIEGIYTPQTIMRNKLTGEIITVPSKIKPKTTFTRTCIDKLSQALHDKQN